MIERWVAQGGFAGDNIVPPQYRLKKFDGKIFCPTFNFGGDSRAAMTVDPLSSTVTWDGSLTRSSSHRSY